MTERGSLEGRAAVVTGGGRGIGRAVAFALAARGAGVVVADRDGDGAAAVASAVESGGGRAVACVVDLADVATAARAVEQAAAVLGSVDVLVNNAAAVGPRHRLVDLAPAAWAEVLAVNLTAAFVLTAAAARQMAAQRSGGAVVNISAIQVASPIPTYGAYAASKGGLEALTRAFAVELAPAGIRVNAVQVGSVFTGGTAAALGLEAGGDDDVPVEIDRRAATLLGRMGRPREVGDLVAVLASDEASWVTGAVLRADGGRLLDRGDEPLAPPDAAR